MISSGSDGDTRTDDNAPQGDCGRYAALLTAYFDGEATAEEAQAARSHLNMCARCARAWTAWGRARRLLRALPVPATPPNLLARIIFACRISVLPRKTVRPSALIDLEYSGASQFDRHMLSDLPLISLEESALSDLSYEAPVIKPGDLPPVVPPPHLQEAILRLTIGADAQKLNKTERAEFATLEPAVEEPAFIVPLVDEVPFALPPRSSLSELARGRARSLARRTGRMATAVAVPAITAWLMVASNFSGQLMQTAQVNPESVVVPATEVHPVPASPRVATRPGFLARIMEQGKNQIKSAAPSLSAQRIMPASVNPASVPPAPATAKAVVTPQQKPAPAVAANQLIALPATPLSVSLPEAEIYTAKVDWQPAGVHSDLDATRNASLLTAPTLPPATAPKAISRTVHSMKAVQPVSSTRAMSRIRPVELPSNVVRPQFQHVVLESSPGLRAARKQLMVSRPPLEPRVPPAPAPSIGDTAEELVEIHTLWNNSPDEMSSTINGFRAALISDSADSGLS